MMDILDKLGGWPVVDGDSWRSDDWDWFEMNRKIRNNGLPDDLILEWRIRTDFMNSSKRIIQVKKIYVKRLNFCPYFVCTK